MYAIKFRFVEFTQYLLNLRFRLRKSTFLHLSDYMLSRVVFAKPWIVCLFKIEFVRSPQSKEDNDFEILFQVVETSKYNRKLSKFAKFDAILLKNVTIWKK